MIGGGSLRILIAVLVGLAVAGMTAWGAGVFYYLGPGGPRVRTALALAFGAVTALAFLALPRRRLTLVVFLFVFAALAVWWLSVAPSNDRDWLPDVAVTPWSTRSGDLVTIHGVRNFQYRTETDFVPRWETRTYDLAKLDSVDLISVTWGSKAIAHTMLSFGFGGGEDYVAISIEGRKEKGEGYSTLGGFFKQYELVYIVGDERDLIGVRTTYRQPPEDVRVYRVNGPLENARRVFLDYLRTMNDMRERPVFYNTLTTNCTTAVFLHTRVNPGRPPFSWKILVSGYVPQLLYERGRIDTSIPFAELERVSRVNDKARVAADDRAFSRRIREGLPIPRPPPRRASRSPRSRLREPGRSRDAAEPGEANPARGRSGPGDLRGRHRRSPDRRDHRPCRLRRGLHRHGAYELRPPGRAAHGPGRGAGGHHPSSARRASIPPSSCDCSTWACRAYQVPHINDARAARAAVAAVRYAPQGDRGMAGASRASDYGKIPMAEHMAQSKREITLAVMVEDLPALDEIDAIAATEGLDIVAVGPSDMSRALGVGGTADHPKLRAAVDRVAEAVRKGGVARLALPMKHPTLPRNAAQLRELGVGYTNCAPAPEVRMLKSMQAQVAEARALLG